MMTSDIESKISRVINKLDNAKVNLNYPPITNETQEGNYRFQKRVAGAIAQVNVNVSCFDDQNESNFPINESINEVSNSFSEQPSDILDQSLPKPNLNRRPSIILDLNKIINVGEYKIELGKLLNILDKKLPDNKENNTNNDASKTYTQCTTEENEVKKSFLSPEKKIEKIDESDEKSLSKEKSEEKNSKENTKNDLDELSKNKKFQENLSKKYHKISLLLKAYMNENKLVNDLNKKCLKENNGIIGNININDTTNNHMNMNYRRKSLFDMNSYIVPSESSIKSFSKNNQLPNLISNFFDQKKLGKRKKRNTYVSGQLRNKLKKLNQQMNTKSTSKKIPQSEKAEFKIKPKRTSIINNSNIQNNNMSSKKSISQISNFDMSNNVENENESIIYNDNSVFDGNDNKRGSSLLFNDGLSAVKTRRQSDFFDNCQQQEEITGFHKMISTIIEEEDNINNINGNNNLEINDEKKDNDIYDKDKDEKVVENKIDNDTGVGNDDKDENEKNNEGINEENNEENKESEDENEEYEDYEEDDDEYDDETIQNDNSCFYGNISTSLCFDELVDL